MAQVNLNIDDLNGFMKHIIDNNRFLQKEGKLPVAIEVLGESGIGKTSTVKQIAEDNDLDFVKLNLAQIEELGDLVGFPVREFQMYKEKVVKLNTNDDNIHYGAKTAASADVAKLSNNTTVTKKIGQWVSELAVSDYLSNGYKMTGKNRMSYAAPEWISDKKKGGILLLDDWNRADVRFIQAVMELIDRQTYISWSLPEDWHIVLTANPDNGDYMVNSVDAAQKTRYITANLQFDANVWARWAEESGIDTRCINFLLLHPELVTQETNARAITTFFNAISSFENFNDSLSYIQMIGEGSVGDEFASMFTIFINNSKDNTINQKITDRLETLCTKEYFTNDLKYLVVRTIFNGNKQKFNKLMMKPEIIKMTVK